MAMASHLIRKYAIITTYCCGYLSLSLKLGFPERNPEVVVDKNSALVEFGIQDLAIGDVHECRIVRQESSKGSIVVGEVAGSEHAIHDVVSENGKYCVTI